MNENPTEQELREILEAEPVSTSAAHDEAVLAAARAFTNEVTAKGSSVRSGQLPDEHAGSRGHRAWFRRWAGALPIAVAASIGALAIVLIPRGPDSYEPETLRGNELRTELPATASKLTSPPAAFHWPAVPGASGYRVTLRDSDAHVIWQSSRVDVNEAVFDVSMREDLASQTYYWSVTVEGNPETTELGPFWFELMRE